MSMPEKNNGPFINLLITEFPELREEVLDDDWIGNLHLQVGCFTRYTQKAIDSNDVSTALKCFLFVENSITDVDVNIENALMISWLSHLSFSKNEIIYSQFPIKLKEIRISLDSYHINPSTNEKLNKFLKDLGANPT